MKDLRAFLDECSRRYYNGDTPLISDEVFDRLAETINYSTLGFEALGKTAKHLFPMFSLQKFYPEDGGEPPLKGTVIIVLLFPLRLTVQLLVCCMSRENSFRLSPEAMEKWVNSLLRKSYHIRA